MPIPLVFPFIAKLVGDGFAGMALSGALTGAGAGAVKTAVVGGDLDKNMAMGAGGGMLMVPALGALTGAGAAGAAGAGEAAAAGAAEAATAASATPTWAATGASGMGNSVMLPAGEAVATAAPAAEAGAFSLGDAAASSLAGQGVGWTFTPPPEAYSIPAPTPEWMYQDQNIDPMALFPQQKQKGWWV